ASSGAPEEFDITRRRGVEGELLTPDILDTLEAWSVENLQDLGYPCPAVSSAAGVERARVVVEVDAGEQRSFGPVLTRGVDVPLAPHLVRFRAFRGDWPFYRTALDATAERLVGIGLVESAQLVPVCSDSEAGTAPR